METSVLLGLDKATGKEVRLTSSARRLGNYVVGIQGMGKSNILVQIALQDIANGEGVCMLTPHSETIQDILERLPESRWNDVIVFNPADECPIGLNIFEWAGPGSGISIEKIADDVVTETFKRLWGDSWGDRMAELMSNVARTILLCQGLPLKHRPTLAEFAKVVGRGKETEYRTFLLNHIEQNSHSLPYTAVDEVFTYWKWFDEQDKRFREEIASSTLNKSRMFRANEILAHVVGQPVNKVNLQSVMDEGKILLVDLDVNKIGKGNVELLGSLLVGRLLLAALGRSSKRLPVFTGAGVIPEPPIAEDDTQTGKGETPLRLFHIIADEFAYFATPAFAELQDQTRKYGVDVLVAHQRRGQLDEETKDATLTARNWIAFSMNPLDAGIMAEGFDSTPPEPEVKGEREPLGYASYPWDALKRQSHENREITDLVHWIDSYLVAGRGIDLIDLADWLRKRLPFDEFISPNTLPRYGITTFRDEAKLSLFESKLNRLLYLMMMGKPIEALSSNILDLGNCIFCSSMWRQDLSLDFGKTTLDTLTEQIEKLKAEHYVHKAALDEWEANLSPPERSSFTTDLGIVSSSEHVKLYSRQETIRNLMCKYAAIAMRIKVLRWIIRLGELLKEFPVWLRGGQPITEYEPPRPHSDVTAEWQNYFSHLPQYEAWVRLQEGRELREYHITTIKAEEPGNANTAFENAQRVRSLSQRTYGTCRAEVEEMLKERILVPGDDSDIPKSDPVQSS